MARLGDVGRGPVQLRSGRKQYRVPESRQRPTRVHGIGRKGHQAGRTLARNIPEQDQSGAQLCCRVHAGMSLPSVLFAAF